MRQRFAIIVTVVLVLGVLIAINAASYESEDERQDTELSPIDPPTIPAPRELALCMTS